MQVFNALGNQYRGTLNKAIVAGDWKGRNYFRTWAKPKNPRTTKQLEVRSFYSEAVGKWKAFTTLDKVAFKHHADFQQKNISGFNSLIGNYVDKRLIAETFVDPTMGTIEVVETGTLLPIEGAIYEIRRHDNTNIYCSGISDEDGLCHDGLVPDDENYDLKVYGGLFYPYYDLDLAAAALFGVHAQVVLEPHM